MTSKINSGIHVTFMGNWKVIDSLDFVIESVSMVFKEGMEAALPKRLSRQGCETRFWWEIE